MGMERTLGLLQERFFWPKMAADIQEHIRSCKRCIHFKLPQERAEMATITASYPLELVDLDFLTIGTKNDSSKNVNVLVITDHFTSYAAAYITLKHMAPVVAKVLWENFFSKLWVARENLGRSREELCKFSNQGIVWIGRGTKIKNHPYYPESNRQCEYFNQMLINMIGSLPAHAKKNWQEWVSTSVSKCL